METCGRCIRRAGLAAVVISGVLLISIPATPVAGNTGGTIYTIDGRPIVTERLWPVATVHYRGSTKVTGTAVRGLFEDPEASRPYKVEVAWTDIAEIESLGGASARVVRRDGTEIVFRDMDLVLPGNWGVASWGKESNFHIYYTFFNKVEKTEDTDRVKCSEVAKIVFGEDSGDFRMCPVDRHYFPPEYLFCPFCGTKTVWAD